MSDSLFWHVVAVGALGLLAAITGLLVVHLRRRPVMEPLRPVAPSARPTVDADATLAAFNALAARYTTYIEFARPDHDLLDTENFIDYPPQLREFSDELLSLSDEVPEVHQQGVDPPLRLWGEKMKVWYAAGADIQADLAAFYERKQAYYANQSVLGWVVDTAVGTMGYDPLVKVREFREAGSQFDAEEVQITERMEKLLSQRDAYLAELNRLGAIYAKRWQVEIPLVGPPEEPEVSEEEPPATSP
jgi:hypothetical protein